MSERNPIHPTVIARSTATTQSRATATASEQQPWIATPSVAARDEGGSVVRPRRRRLFRRGPWENAATALIAAGVIMLMQPFSMTLFSWAFTVILVGTVGFVVVSHFRD